MVFSGGVSGGNLNENEVKLDDVLNGLQLPPEYRDDVRQRLIIIIGDWWDEIEMSPTQSPEARLQDKDIIKSLRAIGRDLSKIGPILRAHEEGIHSSHDTVVVAEIRLLLAEDPEIKNDTADFLKDFCDKAAAISGACLKAANGLSSRSRKRGRRPLGAAAEFARLVKEVALKAGVRPTVVNNPITGEPEGPFLDLAARMELLLWPPMRSPSRVALAQRLKRSAARPAKTRGR